jgi:hypothetical protein
MPNDAVVVTALILQRPTCLDCLARKSGLAPDQLDATLESIRAVLRGHEERARCQGCGETRRVISVSPPDR